MAINDNENIIIPVFILQLRNRAKPGSKVHSLPFSSLDKLKDHILELSRSPTAQWDFDFDENPQVLL